MRNVQLAINCYVTSRPDWYFPNSTHFEHACHNVHIHFYGDSSPDMAILYNVHVSWSGKFSSNFILCVLDIRIFNRHLASIYIVCKTFLGV